MSTDFPGYTSPTTSVEVPLEMLAACHHRIERQCATLRRLAVHLHLHGSDTQASAAASGVLRYFDTAALHHHADEEQDLFPALIESMAGSDPVCIRELTEGLTADHRRLEAMWRSLKIPLQDIAAGTSTLLDQDEVESFAQLYENHMRLEEDELLPMAERLLSDEAIIRIGRAMRQRRGIPD